MTNAESLIGALHAWPEAQGLWQQPALLPSGLVRAVQFVKSEEAARRRLDEFLKGSDVIGWVETSSECRVVRTGDVCSTKGLLLNAEVSGGAADAKHSLHVRQQDSAWLIVEFRDDANGEALLKDQVELAGQDRTVEHWIYDRYWSAQEDGRLQLVAARLAGARTNGAGSTPA